MENFVAENDKQSYQRHNKSPIKNDNKSSQLSGLISIDDRCYSNATSTTNTANIGHSNGDGTEQEQQRPLSNSIENTATTINTIPTTNTGGSTYDAYNNHNFNTNQSNNCDEEEFTTVSMSPDERNTFFPSSSSSSSRRMASLQEYNYTPSGNNDPVYHPTIRPTRESVLQRLYEALLRRSLTKVRTPTKYD